MRSAAPFTTSGRAWWLKALDFAAEAGDQLAAGEELSREQKFDLAGLVVRAGTTPFPLDFASARAGREGLVQLLRGTVHAAQPELRAALALAMAAAARCCRRMLELDVAEQAAAHRRRFGED